MATCVKSTSVKSSDVTQWLSCIMGNVVARFGWKKGDISVLISCVHILFINTLMCWTYSVKVQQLREVYCDYFTIKVFIHIYFIFRYILSRAFIVKGPEVTVSAAEWERERRCIINTQHHNTHTRNHRATNKRFLSFVNIITVWRGGNQRNGENGKQTLRSRFYPEAQLISSKWL